MSKPQLIELEDVTMHHETEKAYLVSTNGDSDDGVWVPKSAVEFEPKATRSTVGTLTLPEDLAIEKELI